MALISKKNKKIVFTEKNIIFIYNTIYLATTYLYSVLSYKYFKCDKKMVEYVENVITNNILTKLREDPEFAIKLINSVLYNTKISSNYSYTCNINLCIAYKNLGNFAKVDEILFSMDWSNCNDMFILAKYVLLSDKENIIKYMKKFTSPEWKLYYQEWPLFDDLRNQSFFKVEYKKLFKEEFVYNYMTLDIETKNTVKKTRKK